MDHSVRVIVSLICLCVAAVSHAQDTTVAAPARLLTINPIALVDPFGPSSLRVGGEMLVSPRITLALEGSGYYQYIPVDRDDPEEHLQGGGIRFSVIHWQKRSAGYARGISLDLGYKNTVGTVSDSIKIDGAEPYNLAYGIDRKVITVRLCMVEQRHWAKRFWTELYYGVGVRFKNATSSGITEEELDARDFSAGTDNDNYIVPAMHGVGEFIQPDLVIGLRLGYAWR